MGRSRPAPKKSSRSMRSCAAFPRTSPARSRPGARGSSSSTSATALRYFNVYGPRMDIRSKYVEVMVRWLDLIDQQKPLVLFGDGSASADFVYVDDVVRANLLACDTKTGDAIVNVCTGVETRM